VPPYGGVVLPEQAFVRALMGVVEEEVTEEEGEITVEEKGRWMSQFHNSPMVGYPGVKRT
jgi:hypothetical protein